MEEDEERRGGGARAGRAEEGKVGEEGGEGTGPPSLPQLSARLAGPTLLLSSAGSVTGAPRAARRLDPSLAAITPCPTFTAPFRLLARDGATRWERGARRAHPKSPSQRPSPAPRCPRPESRDPREPSAAPGGAAARPLRAAIASPPALDRRFSSTMRVLPHSPCLRDARLRDRNASGRAGGPAGRAGRPARHAARDLGAARRRGGAAERERRRIVRAR